MLSIHLRKLVPPNFQTFRRPWVKVKNPKKQVFHEQNVFLDHWESIWARYWIGHKISDFSDPWKAIQAKIGGFHTKSPYREPTPFLLLTHPFYHTNLDWFSWEWSKKNIFLKKKNSKWPLFENVRFSKSSILEIFLPKFCRSVLGLVGLIDAKAIKGPFIYYVSTCRGGGEVRKCQFLLTLSTKNMLT